VTRASPFLTGWVKGRLDALGLLIGAEIGVSVVLVVSTEDPRLILARPAVYLAVVGAASCRGMVGRLPRGSAMPMGRLGPCDDAVCRVGPLWPASPAARPPACGRAAPGRSVCHMTTA